MLFGLQWYYWLILLVAVVLTIFAWSKALKSSKARRERLKREAAIWKRDYELRERFAVLTEDKIKETEETELLHGVAMNIQMMLEKAVDMTSAFNALPHEKKMIYALEYFDEDAKKSLSTFFRNNGEPLTPVVPEALEAIGCEKYLSIIAPLVSMFDPDSDVSVDNTIIARADEEFASAYNSDELCRLSARFIIKNKDIFLG
jgi:hypothetical protein